MLVGIFGLPGVGKTALNTHFLIDGYMREGEERLERAIEMIKGYAREQRRIFTLPDKPPYYATYDVNFLVDYEEYFTPYTFNPYYFGFKNNNLSVMRLAPYAQIHIMEAQKYLDSRQSATFPGWTSRAYEMHRHFNIDMYYDVQRIDLVDLNIRRITEIYYCVLGMKHAYRKNGSIERSFFHVLRFNGYNEVNGYLSGKGGGVREIIEHKGNIFECYDSYDGADEFIPTKGEDFEYITRESKGARAKELNELTEPYGFRHKAKER